MSVRNLLCCQFFFYIISAWISVAQGQAVSGVITDYGSYWKSSALLTNPVKPNKSHNLLAFTYNGVQYSTGANDLILLNNHENFVAGDFWSLPVGTVTGTVNSNTKVGVGELYDGVHIGASSPPPVNNLSYYLTDGIKGLGIGTCIANLPAGSMTFLVNSILPENIGDGIPDILVTQVADPSGSTDSYSFVDDAGNQVGHSKSIVFTTISPVGNWTADFYEASTNPMVLTAGFTNTDRPIRIWAADLADFGINGGNYQAIRRFQVSLSGNSDIAFAAYNNKTFSISALDVKLQEFAGAAKANSVVLYWSTLTEAETRSFVVERSPVNNNYQNIGSVPANGNSQSKIDYRYTDLTPVSGSNFYRLKITDADGQLEYSKVIQVNYVPSSAVIVTAFPNPCAGNIIVRHPARQHAYIRLYSPAGIAVYQAAVLRGTTQTHISLQTLEKGLYYMVFASDQENSCILILKNR